MTSSIDNKITEELEKIPGLAERIEKSTSIEDTAEVAIELYSTLGFCHGFLGKDKMKIPYSFSKEFPWNENTWETSVLAYAAEYKKGLKFREEME